MSAERYRYKYCGEKMHEVDYKTHRGYCGKYREILDWKHNLGDLKEYEK
jgi:hypothetical protein